MNKLARLGKSEQGWNIEIHNTGESADQTIHVEDIEISGGGGVTSVNKCLIDMRKGHSVTVEVKKEFEDVDSIRYQDIDGVHIYYLNKSVLPNPAPLVLNIDISW